jgi:hypothetical protein
MPPQATRKPEITDVVRKPMPVTIPTSPLALSRSFSGMRIVTSVGSAIDRILPAITPNITSRMNNQSCHAATLRMASSGVSNSMANAKA